MPDPIKIAFLKTRLEKKGGLEKYTQRLIEAFSQKNCLTYLLCAHSTGSSAVHHVFFPSNFVPQYKKMALFDKKVQKWIHQNRPEIVFGLDRNSFQTHIRLGNGIHKAYLQIRSQYEGPFKRWSFQKNPLHQKILELEKTALENPYLQRVYTNSHLVKEQALSYYKINPEKIKVIHNGVEWKEFKSSFEAWEEVKKNQTLFPSRFTFLFLGNGFYRKGLLPLMEALSVIPNKEWQLLVLGKEKKLSFFKKQAEKLKIKEHIFFLGEQKDPTFFYQIADTLVIPSFYDPFANVTLEALAMGVPVISSLSNGASEILTKENGFIIPDLFQKESFQEVLEKAMRFPKTRKAASFIRSTVEKFDFSFQLEQMVEDTLSFV